MAAARCRTGEEEGGRGGRERKGGQEEKADSLDQTAARSSA